MPFRMEQATGAIEAIAAEVRAAMGRRKVTAATLAERTDISPASLSRKLNAKSQFTVDELFAVAEALEVEPTTLFPSEERTQPVVAIVPSTILRTNQVLEGAETLEDVATQLLVLASYVRRLDQAGWALESPISAGAGVLVPPADGVWDGVTA